MADREKKRRLSEIQKVAFFGKRKSIGKIYKNSGHRL